MPEHDPLIFSYRHLADFPRAKDALETLKKIASVVKPLMRARGWKVPELAEFYPNEHNLLGLNVNRGQKILLRLRHPGDRNQFLPREQVTDTMLHELAHIVHGPHDSKFHALWNQLRDEHESLLLKGYTGEGFLSDGRRLGGGHVLPVQEARRLARVEAEKRRVRNLQARGSGQRLGGVAPAPGQDIRRTIASAVDRRNATLRGCGNEGRNEGEIRAIGDTATRNGFKTQAEEDAANEAAIAQALWELGQEEEKEKYGGYYVPPSRERPEGSQGSVARGAASSGRLGSSSAPITIPSSPAAASVVASTSHPQARGPPPSIPTPTRPPAASRPSVQPRPPTMSAPAPNASLTSRGLPYARPVQQAPKPKGWTCGICTLFNPPTYLCCDACGKERGEDVTRQLWTPNSDKREGTRNI